MKAMGVIVKLLVFVSLAAGALAVPPDEEFIVAGYLPEYRSYIDANRSSVHLTDLILFSMSPQTVLMKNEDGVPRDGCCLEGHHFEQAREARDFKKRTRGTDIRLLVSVGGGGRSNGFKDIATNQRGFLLGLARVCREERLDGVDLDLEGISSYEEWNAYEQFIKKAAGYLHSMGLVLSVALHRGQHLRPSTCSAVDRVNVMAYDIMPGPNDRRKGHHASMGAVEETMTQFVAHGCKPSKLVLGVPAYARHATNKAMVLTYSEIVDKYMASHASLQGGKVMAALFSMSSYEGFEFDGPSDVRLKVAFALENGFAGVFFWEIGQDKQLSGGADGGILIEAASSAVPAKKRGVSNEDGGNDDDVDETGVGVMDTTRVGEKRATREEL